MRGASRAKPLASRASGARRSWRRATRRPGTQGQEFGALAFWVPALAREERARPGHRKRPAWDSIKPFATTIIRRCPAVPGVWRWDAGTGGERTEANLRKQTEPNLGKQTEPNAASKRQGSPRRPLQISPACRPDDVAAVVDQGTAQEGALHPAGEFHPFERGVALHGFRLGGADHEAFVRVDQRNVGVVAGRDIALAQQPEALCRLPAQELGHVVVGHA